VGNILASFSEDLTEAYTSDTIYYYWEIYTDKTDNMNNIIPQVKHFHQNTTLFKRKGTYIYTQRC